MCNWVVSCLSYPYHLPISPHKDQGYRSLGVPRLQPVPIDPALHLVLRSNHPLKLSLERPNLIPSRTQISVLSPGGLSALSCSQGNPSLHSFSRREELVLLCLCFRVPMLPSGLAPTYSSGRFTVPLRVWPAVSQVWMMS